MTPQQEQAYLLYVHTHGKVARCWHELELKFTKDENEFQYYECKCGAKKGTRAAAHINRNPTISLDYLVQRCEEEGFWWVVGGDPNNDGKFEAILSIEPNYDFTYSAGDMGTPQHALLIATARALGWGKE